MRIEEPGAGYIHFSENLNDEYFKQLTAEKIVTKFHKGFKRREFIKTRPRNEALDCFVYALAAYAIVGINVNSLADRMEAQEPDEPKAEPRKTVTQPFVPRVGRNFVNSWR
jgi:phage terminase large subunit GpA-like protein